MKRAYFLLFLIIVYSCTVFGRQKGTIKGSFIFPLQQKHAHGSTLVSLPNGDLLAAWFYGSGERGADDVCIMGARKPAGNSAWSKPFLMADTKGLPDCNPVLFLNHKKQLFLVWIAVQANRWEQSIIRYRIADHYEGSGAPNWIWQDNILLKPDDAFAQEMKEKIRKLPKQEHAWAAYAPPYDQLILEAAKDPAKRSLGWMTRIKPLLLPGGRLLLPLYSDGLNCSLLAISEDDGESWFPSLPIVGRGNIQPVLLQKKNGDLVAFMRDNGDAPARIQQSKSQDGGRTWTAVQPTDIPNTASVEAVQLQDGRWLLVGNDVSDGRYQLSIYVSNDEGSTWKKWKELEADPTKKLSCSYPALIQSADGMIHISYSYQQAPNQKSIKYVNFHSNEIK